MKPFFSIIIPTYNRGHFISTAINSVINQSHNNWELLIIDDGSTDNTQELISDYTDERIIYIKQKNKERSAARNHGIRLAKGKWVCFLDSDDYYENNHLSNFKNFIDKNNDFVGLISSGVSLTGTINRRKDFLNLNLDNPLKEVWNKFLLPTQVCIHHSVLIDNKFNEKLSLWEDTHLWLRIIAQYPAHQIKTYTCVQVLHNQGTVYQLFEKIKPNAIELEIEAVKGLFIEYRDIISNYLTPKDLQNHVDKKYRMFLYQARQNKQPGTSLIIWMKAIKNQPSFYLFTELPKIFINVLGIGIHVK